MKMRQVIRDNSLRERIIDLQIRLMSVDLFGKEAICNEFLELIEGIEEEKKETKAQLYAIVVPHLIDLNKKEKVSHIVDYLLQQDDYHFHLNALYAKSEMAKRANDWNEYVNIFNEGLIIAETNHDTIALSQGYVMKAKGLMRLSRFQEALEDLNLAIPLAESFMDFKLVAVAKYYIGATLWKMDHTELALEKFREASDLAHEQKCSDIIKHTEVARALYLLKNGQAKAAEGLLETWYREFELML